MLSERMLPQAAEMETALLGACLRDSSVIPLAQMKLKNDHFWSASNRMIWCAMVSAFERDMAKPVDVVVVASILDETGNLEKIGGMSYLASLIDEGSPAHAGFYVDTIYERARSRAIIGACVDIEDALLDGGTTGDAEAKLYAALRREDIGRARDLKEITGDVLAYIEACKSGEPVEGTIKYPWKCVQDTTGGMRKGHLIVIAGRPSMGKSSFALNLAEHAASEGKPVLLFSLEMQSSEIGLGLLCSMSRVSSHKVRGGFIDERDRSRLDGNAGKMAALPITIDDSARTLTEICARARLLRASKNIGLVIVDYLQLIQASHERGQSREQEVSHMSLALKNLGAELGIPLIYLSQLNRKSEARDDKRPLLSDLRESGSIEQDADEVFLIHRNSYYTHDESDYSAEVLLAKQRTGPQRMFDFVFQREYTRFEELSHQTEQSEVRSYVDKE